MRKPVIRREYAARLECNLPSKNNSAEITQVVVWSTDAGVMSNMDLVAKPPLAPPTKRCEQRLLFY